MDAARPVGPRRRRHARLPGDAACSRALLAAPSPSRSPRRRRAPGTATLVCATGALVAAGGARGPTRAGVPVEVFFAVIVCVVLGGRALRGAAGRAVGAPPWRRSRQAISPGRGSSTGTTALVPAAWLAFAVAWLVGRDLRRRRQRVARLEGRAERLEREREEEAQRRSPRSGRASPASCTTSSPTASA